MMAGVIFTTYYIVTVELDKIAQGQLKEQAKVVEYRFSDIQQNALSLAISQSIRPNVIKGILTGDGLLLTNLAKSLIESKSTEFVVFVDTNGKIISNDEESKVDETLSNSLIFKNAINNTPTVGIIRTGESGIVLRAASPVKENGKIIGAVVLGSNIFQGDTFVDTIKSIASVECTIFEHDMRVATTIMRDGKRAIGTKMDNPVVLQTVLQSGKDFNSKNIILGVDYATYYWPLKDVQNKTIGMFFIGKSMEEITNSQMNILKTIVIFILLIALVAAIMNFLFGRAFVKPIIKATSYASDIAKGKQVSPLVIKNRDEIGDLASSLNSMVVNLVAMKKEGLLQAASSIDGIVERLTTASELLLNQIQKSSKGADDQKHKLNGVASAMEEMTATVLEISQNTAKTSDLSEGARQQAVHGSDTVMKSVHAMQDVLNMSESLKKQLTQLGDYSNNIGKVVGIISDIANQTKILSLNATIEAARAGSAGHGFAVVAKEIGDLASQTTKATNQVSDSVSMVQSSIKESIASMEKTNNLIGDTTTLVNNSGSILKQILELSQDVSHQISSIAAAIEEQTATTNEINRNVDDVNNIAMETSKIMIQSERAVEELNKQSSELRELVETLKRS